MPTQPYFGGRDKRQQKSFSNKPYYRTLIDLKREPCLLADMDGDILIVNQAFVSLAQFAEDELHGNPLRSILLRKQGSEHPLESKVLREFDEGFLLLNAQGWLLPVQVSFKEIEGQKFLVTFGIEAEQEKRPIEAEAARPSVEAFEAEATLPLRSVSPSELPAYSQDELIEIRTQLSALYGMLRLMKEDAGSGIDASNRQRIEDAIRALEKLKNKVIRSEGAEGVQSVQYKIEAVNLADVLSNAVAGQRQLSLETGLGIALEGERMVHVLTDQAILSDALNWLLGKALRYCRGAQVLVSVSRSPDQKAVIINVDNIGLELSASLIERIRKPGATNDQVLMNELGMFDKNFARLFSLSRQAGLQWDFELVKPGKIIGRLQLEPLGGDSLEAAIRTIEQQFRELKLSVLIVEDDRINARILEDYLSAASEVYVAYSGNEALNILEFTLATSPIHVVLMDFTLPPPWDGQRLRTEMIRRFPLLARTIFIVQTAMQTDELPRKLEEEFSCIMQKPVDRLQLLKNILAKWQELSFENTLR
ncbi:MAG: response regulator [Bacteroidetes bacterium]|nr:response regulator [Bacteroidota bacterium]